MGRLMQFSNMYPKIFRLVTGISNHILCYGKRGHKTKFVCDGLLQVCKTRINGTGNTIEIGAASRLKNCSIKITGDNNRIIIGKGCLLINAELYIEDNNGTIIIGNGTGICGKTQLAVIEGCSIIIGEECLLSSEINLRTGDSHTILDENCNRINPSASIIIDDHVWIGNRAIILKGTHLESDTIVATGAVVTHSQNKSNCILAGNPARIVKESISWQSER